MNDETRTMRRVPGDGPEPSWLDLLSVAARPRRLAVLTTLAQRDSLSITELTTEVAATLDGIRLTEVNDERRQEVRIGLYHDQLPALRSRALVEWRHGDAPPTIRTGPAFVSAHVEQVRTAVEDGGLDSSTALALADRPRRRVAAALAHAGRPMGLESLVERIGRVETFESTVGSNEELHTRLHHADLPVLDDAEVVEYRTNARVATYRGLPPTVESAVTGT